MIDFDNGDLFIGTQCSTVEIDNANVLGFTKLWAYKMIKVLDREIKNL